MKRKAVINLIILGILLIITISLSVFVASHIFSTQPLPTIYARKSPVAFPTEDDLLPVDPAPELQSELDQQSDEADIEYDADENADAEPVDFSFENGVEGLEELTDLILAYINPLGGSYSIYVKNLDTNEYLLINNQRQTPASLIKLFNVVYAFERIENGSLELTPSIEGWLYNSIIISCNNSFNHLLAVFGYGNLIHGAMNATAFAQYSGFEDTIVGSSLYPSDFEIAGFSDLYTSVLDVGHLLENIYRGTMVSEEASEQMLNILLAQQRLHKIPAGLPEGTVTASKTGEIGALEHDAAIVFTEHTNYVIVIMTENAPSAIFNIQEISRLVYNYFALASAANGE